MVEEPTQTLTKQEETLVEPCANLGSNSDLQDNSSFGNDCIEEIVDGNTSSDEQTNKIPSKRKKMEKNKLNLRRERDRVRQRIARQNEDDEKRKLRLEKDRMRKKVYRQNEDDFEKLRRRDKDRERRAKKRELEKQPLNSLSGNDNADSGVQEKTSTVNVESHMEANDSQINNTIEAIKAGDEMADIYVVETAPCGITETEDGATVCTLDTVKTEEAAVCIPVSLPESDFK